MGGHADRRGPADDGTERPGLAEPVHGMIRRIVGMAAPVVLAGLYVWAMIHHDKRRHQRERAVWARAGAR